MKPASLHVEKCGLRRFRACRPRPEEGSFPDIAELYAEAVKRAAEHGVHAFDPKGFRGAPEFYSRFPICLSSTRTMPRTSASSSISIRSGVGCPRQSSALSLTHSTGRRVSSLPAAATSRPRERSSGGFSRRSFRTEARRSRQLHRRPRRSPDVTSALKKRP